MSDFGAVEGIRDEGAAAMLPGLPDAVVEDEELDDDAPAEDAADESGTGLAGSGT
ncbi:MULTISPECIES: hypothetical protein [Plantibacter]|uniref:hypothetical protein n=1 Tax=Plantibacter TaxID=190323 RepID=UPI0013DE6BFA|nr:MULTISPECIES: hypothetical protein [Plantibacter]MDD9152955.1 hypothetical protein [Plantibacter flavus]